MSYRAAKLRMLDGADKARCYYCELLFAEADLSVDHVIPRSKGGKTNRGNTVLACIACNNAKGDGSWDHAMKREHAAILDHWSALRIIQLLGEGGAMVAAAAARNLYLNDIAQEIENILAIRQKPRGEGKTSKRNLSAHKARQSKMEPQYQIMQKGSGYIPPWFPLLDRGALPEVVRGKACQK